MIFDSIAPAPPDPILGLTEAFKKDANPLKVNLGVGVYQDDEGRTPVLRAVKAAEELLLKSEKTKAYLPIVGSPEYAGCVQELIFGKDHPAVRQGRVRTAHTPGGTGGLRVGADFLRKLAPSATAWLSAPTWPNHKGIFTAAGFRLKEYPYYDPQTHALDFGAMTKALRRAAPGDVVVLHVCCHNPTGVDLAEAQWREVAAIARERGWVPFFDFAYQGLGTGLSDDRVGVLPMIEAGVDMLVSSSFSKNFGLYNERVGALTLVTADPKAADPAFGHVKIAIRVLYSNPASHGGAIVSTILADPHLRADWESELNAMRERIASVRWAFVEELKRRRAPMDFSFITQQRGMFSFSGLTDAQVSYLREKKSVYIVAGGRINVAGITSKNLGYLSDSIVEAMASAG